MQDIRSMSGAAGRIFAGDRRMRPHPHQALKCPRCDSLNTKFCYYNNYNMSQPRHFCKACRRYWTKGGVLRNVPVGGGSRKTKRSKPKSNATDDADEAHRRDQRKSAAASHSSSDSSTLTATAASAPTAADAPASAASASSSSSAALLNFPDSAAPIFSNPLSGDNPPQFDPPASMIEDSSIFSEAGTFTSLMTGSNPALLGINFADLAVSGPLRFQQPQIQQQQQQQKMVGLMEGMKMQELTAGFLDQTVSVELPPLQSRGLNGGLTALDWQSNGDDGLYDLAGGVIDQAYWSQTQWVDNDHTLYLP